jgi:hypothetical protein
LAISSNLLPPSSLASSAGRRTSNRRVAFS